MGLVDASRVFAAHDDRTDFITDDVQIARELEKIIRKGGHVAALIVSDWHFFTHYEDRAFVKAMFEAMCLFNPDFFLKNGDIWDHQYRQDRDHRPITEMEARLQDRVNVMSGHANTVETGGNHEVEYLEGGKDAYAQMMNEAACFSGTQFQERGLFVDPRGRRFEYEHGDGFDSEKIRKFYGIGSKLYGLGNSIDRMRIENFPVHLQMEKSLLTWGKRLCKGLVIQGFEQNAADSMPAGSYGKITGHIHKPANKIITASDGRSVRYLNSGDMPQSCSFIICTQEGKWMSVNWPKIRMMIPSIDPQRLPSSQDALPRELRAKRDLTLAQIQFVMEKFPALDQRDMQERLESLRSNLEIMAHASYPDALPDYLDHLYRDLDIHADRIAEELRRMPPVRSMPAQILAGPVPDLVAA